MENKTNSSTTSSRGGFINWLAGLLPTDNDSTFLPPFNLSGWIYFIAGLVPSLIIGWVIFPLVLYSSEPQPMNFNHALHLDEEIVDGIEGDTEAERCEYCHEFRDDGTFAGLPKLEKCTECHDDPESPLGDTPQEQKFMDEYVANEKEIPWLSYSKQPDCVYFSHIAHVKMGEVECRACHGDHAKTKQLPAYKENRLTGYSIDIWGRNIAGWKHNTWDRMKMDDCAECHSEKGKEENNACFVCHK
ncbi:menaquinone reductase multiheme cytochrome c subunit QrcA [Thermodesulfobacteriota bacterium]